MLLLLSSINCQTFWDREPYYDQYVRMFTLLNSFAGSATNQGALNRLQRHFFGNFFSGTTSLTAQVPSILDELIAISRSGTANDSLQTTSYGLVTNGIVDRILVSGAKGSTGKKSEYVASVCFSESSDGSASGVLMAYSQLYPNGRFLTQIKGTDFDLISLEENGTYVIAFAESSKLQFRAGEAIVGTTVIHKLSAGRNHIKYTSYLVTAGASSEKTHVRCSSSTMVTNILVTSSLEIKSTKSAFVSTNKTDKKSSVASHMAAHAVDARDVASFKAATGFAMAENGIAMVQNNYREIVFSK